jgi:DNA-directed RNA polymerase subunit RPC12/RpoP
MSNNPWLVESVQAFSYLKCPECDFNSKDESIFQDHAVENHPLSFVLFGENMDKDDDFIKMEPHVEMKESPGFISFSENKATKFKLQNVTIKKEASSDSSLDDEEYEKNRNTETNRELGDVSLEVENEDYQEDGNDKTGTLIYNLDVVHQAGTEEIILLASNGKVQYRCGNCSLTILLKEDLLKHFETLHKDKKYDVSLDESYLCRDSVLIPKFSEEYACRECKSAFGGEPDLKRHIKMFHLKLEPIKCNLCDFSTTRIVFLKAHMISNHNETKLHNCLICNTRFIDSQALKKHAVSVHTGMEKPLHICLICGTRFINSQELKRHAASVHSGMEKPASGNQQSYKNGQIELW